MRTRLRQHLRSPIAIAVALAAITPALASGRAFNDYRTLLVSRASGVRGAPATADSSAPSASLDASDIAFVSQARNLRPRRAADEVFSRDVPTGRTSLVSRANGAHGAPANGNSTSPASSGSGHTVAFVSTAGNLGGRGGERNVYVRDLTSGRTILVSRASGGGGAKGNGDSFAPAISANGKKVVFASDATNLVHGAAPVTNVYLRDLRSDRTTLVSRGTGAGGAAGNGDSMSPAISSTGNAVAFASTAGNLGAPRGSAQQVYERRLRSNTTVLVSRGAGATGAPANQAAGDPSVDGDGGRVAFDTRATNLGDGAKPVENVYLRDLGSGATVLVSRSGGRRGAGGDRDSSLPDLPRDGRFVCFQSVATNLGNSFDGFGEDTKVSNVYTHDTLHNGTFLISRKPGRHSQGANGDSTNVSCSAGASFAAFQSSATNLEGARPGVTQVYRRTIFGGH